MRQSFVRTAVCVLPAALVVVGVLALCGADSDAGAPGSAQAIGAFLDGALPAVTPPPPDNNAPWALVDAFPNLPSFTAPVHLVQRPGTNALWLLELRGRIYSFDNRTNVSQRTQVVDLGSTVLDQHDSGAMSFAFHPNFGLTGEVGTDEVFIAYRWVPTYRNRDQGYVRLSRFRMAANGNTLNRSSEEVLIQQYDAHNWHNGCAILFGPDGFLYMTVGDEGAANDAFNAAQEIDVGLFSGVLRIDVDRDLTRSHPIRRQPVPNTTPPAGFPGTFTQGYTIPNDNPFLDPDGDLLEEFYCLGLRSPHRMSMDPVTNEMWIGDIGQGAIEDISIVRRAANFEWPWKEGNRANRTRPSITFGDDTPPEFDYGRDLGRCVIGGVVYRGSKFPSLYGRYLFGDNGSNYVYARTRGTNAIEQLVQSPLPGGQANGITSINADANGEVYILALQGRHSSGARIRTLQRGGEVGAQPPARLSQTGAFTSLSSLTPATGVRPYEVNTPLWSDGADKLRFIALPNNGTHNSASEQIGFSATGNWTFPTGTVLIKHFELEGTRLETRFMVHGSDGTWYGLTYRWRADQSDADLLPGSFEAPVTAAGETFTWHYPSRQECMTCHTAAAGHVLGVRTQQINRDCVVPGVGARNQLRLWNDAGMFDGAFDANAVEGYARSRAIGDDTATLERRARSYLDSNCSQCHQPGGARSQWDARFSSPPRAQYTLDVDPGDDLGISNARVIALAAPARSVLYERVNTLDGCCAMPALGKARIDTVAVLLLRQWIESMESASLSSRSLSEQNVNDMIAAGDLDAPLVALAAPASTPASLFDVRVQVTEPLIGLNLSDFLVTNGSAESLSQSGDEWTLTVRAAAVGAVRVSLAADKAWDGVGNANTASNRVTTTYAPVTPPPPGESEPVGPADPAFWMRLNEGTGAESAGTGANGTRGALRGGATWTDGRFDRGVYLDGSGWVDVPYTNALSITDTITLATWVRADRLRDWDGVITAGGAKSPWALQLWSDGAIRFTANWDAPSGAQGGGSWNSNGHIARNVWHHIAVTYDGSTLRFYIDGQPDSRTVSVDLRFGVGDRRFVLGAGLPGADEFFQGAMDDARVYPRALSAVEVESLVDAGTPPPPPPVDTTPPSVVLATTATTVAGPFSVDVTFNEFVSGVDVTDFAVGNANATLSGAGASYQLRLVPIAEGLITISLPANRANDAAGNGNVASNAVAVAYAPAPPPVANEEPVIAGPAALWLPFNEGSGTFATPLGANAHAGRLTGTAAWTAGRFGTAVRLDGASHVAVSATTHLEIPGAMTVSAWVNADRLRDWDAIATRGGFRSPWGFTQGPAGRLRFTANWGEPTGASGSGTWVSQQQITVGTWHHVAVVYDGTRVRFYVDGQADEISYAVDLVFGVGESRMVVGAGLPASDEFFQGALDDVRVYARALDAATIRVLAGLEASTTPAPPSPSISLRVNFQPASATTPAGALADAGDVYGSRGSRWYGWALNHTHAVAQRDVATDPLVDTVIAATNATWELEVVPGTYEITLVAGDPSVNTVAHVTAEGTPVWNGTAVNAGTVAARTVTVVVNDGRLTLSMGPAMTHLAYVEIRSTP